MATFTRTQIEAIDVGSMLAWGLGDGFFGKPQPVVEITCRREDIHGERFVNGYRAFGPGSRISFSIKEGNGADARLYRMEA
jgi:hypothetical protein